MPALAPGWIRLIVDKTIQPPHRITVDFHPASDVVRISRHDGAYNTYVQEAPRTEVMRAYRWLIRTLEEVVAKTPAPVLRCTICGSPRNEHGVCTNLDACTAPTYDLRVDAVKAVEQHFRSIGAAPKAVAAMKSVLERVFLKKE